MPNVITECLPISRLPDINKTHSETSVASAINGAMQGWNVQRVAVDADFDIQHDSDQPKAVYLVESGWIYSYALLAGGQRQILFLHQAGDLAGFDNLSAERASCSLRSLGDCVIRPIPIAAFSDPAFLIPEIATLLLRKSAQMQSVLMSTLIAVGRMEARHRIVWFILMLHDRLEHSEKHHAVIEMPFNQSEIGDLIGLTNVSVSKMLCQLSEEGFIERKGKRIVLRRLSDLQTISVKSTISNCEVIPTSPNSSSQTAARGFLLQHG